MFGAGFTSPAAGAEAAADTILTVGVARGTNSVPSTVLSVLAGGAFRMAIKATVPCLAFACISVVPRALAPAPPAANGIR